MIFLFSNVSWELKWALKSSLQLVIMSYFLIYTAYSSGIRDWGICSSRVLVVHPTQPYLLSTCEEMKLWDWDEDWKCIQKFGREHIDSITHVAFSPHDTFASASSDHTIKV